MSSRFVSGGTITGTAAGTEDAACTTSPVPASTTAETTSKSAEWERAQKHLDAERQRRQEARAKLGSGEQERSLYDVLQANKAAKEAAAAEASKLTNQFRALDNDEIDFLDEVAAKKRREEENVRRETEERLRAFRAASAANKKAAGEDDEAEKDGEDEWGTGVVRKRKRKTEREAGLGVVRRKLSAGWNDDGCDKVEGKKEGEKEVGDKVREENKVEKKEEPQSKKALALVDYGSDSD